MSEDPTPTPAPDPVKVNRADLDALLDVLRLPLSMPTGATIADWLETDELCAATAACRRIETATRYVVSDPQKTGKTLHRLKIQGDTVASVENQVWIDDRLTSNVTSVAFRIDTEGVNQATVGLLLVDGLQVDTVTRVLVDEPTHELLVSLGWRPPLTEPRTFDYPVGAPLTDEEAAELELRLREELAKPHTYKVLPGSEPQPQRQPTDEEAWAQYERQWGARPSADLPEPRRFKYPAVDLPATPALVTDAVVQIPDPDAPGEFFPVQFAASCDRMRPWPADLPDRISAVLQDSVHPSDGGE